MSLPENSKGLLSQEEYQQMAAASTAVKRKRGKADQGGRLGHRHRAQSIIQSKALDELETEVETGLYENVDLSLGSRIPIIGAQVLYSFLWWSVFDALLPMIWFFPLCALQISGFEVICILWFSPVLALIGPIRRALATPSALLILRLLTLVGVASYQSPTTLSRLIVLGVGNMFASLSLVSMWWGHSKLDRQRAISSHILGFLLMLALRVWFTSFNPIFTNFLTNNVATGVGVLLSLYLFFQDRRTPAVTLQDLPSTKVHHEEKEKYPGLLVTGVGFGALIFLTLWLFGDVSVVSCWAVAPYPDRGPYPYPWSFLIMAALVLGLILMTHRQKKLTGLSWHAIGLASGMGLYYLDSYLAFLEGGVLALYTMSLWPHLTKRITSYHPGKVLPIALFTMVVLFLASVWVVAYNFVPGGTLTRERTEVLMGVVIFLVAAASRNYSSQEQVSEKSVNGQQDVRKKGKKGGAERKVAFQGLRKRHVSSLPPICEEEEEEEMEEEGEDGDLPEFEVDSTGSVHEERALEVLVAEEKEHHKFVHRANKVAVAILVVALLGFAYRYHPISPHVQTEHPKVFSAGIWAFHFGYDNLGYPSMERAAQLINNTGVDVIGLLETDAARPYIGNHDIASWLSERLDMYVDYGPGTKDHTWGALVLSKYPIVRSEHHLLPSPDGELAPGMLVTVNISGNLVDFFCVHFGNDVDVLDRKLQAEFTGEVLARATHPIVMLSYITNEPHGRDYKRIVEHGKVKDIDPGDRHRWCEYIFYRGLIKLGYARISHGGLSDTEVQVGKFRLPDSADEPDNDVITHSPQDVPQWMHFPAVFGERYRKHYYSESSHHYHMDTPKYFKLN